MQTLSKWVLIVISLLWPTFSHAQRGRKTAPSEAGIHRNWSVLGVAMVLAIAWFVFLQLRG